MTILLLTAPLKMGIMPYSASVVQTSLRIRLVRSYPHLRYKVTQSFLVALPDSVSLDKPLHSFVKELLCPL